jgi:hypothetical protein
VSSDPLQFDVHGMRILVHSRDEGWLAEWHDADHPVGSPRSFRIPSWVQAEELPRFLAALFRSPTGIDVSRSPSVP